MVNRRLYVVHGVGNDAVGLIRSLVTPIAQAGGNVVDIRQDVLHGLFSFIAVVDLSEGEMRIDALRAMVARIAEDTGLTITVDNYVPRPRDPERKAILLILVGRDAPGIIAQTAELLSRYRINIEFSRTVARQGVFLMELLCDVHRCAIPQEHLMADLREAMAARDIQALFQLKDVFNKQKRVVLFDIERSFLEQTAIEEVLKHTGIGWSQAVAVWGSTDSSLGYASRIATNLEGLSTDVLESIVKTIQPTDGTVELVQSLKVLGYRIAVSSHGFSFFTEALRDSVAIDHGFGIPLEVDADTRTVGGQLTREALSAIDRERVIGQLTSREGIAESDVTVLSDAGLAEVPGIRLDFDLAALISHHKRHVLSDRTLLGVLGSFGQVRPVAGC